MALITLLSCDELIAIVLLSVCAHKSVYFPFVDFKFKYPFGALLHLWCTHSSEFSNIVVERKGVNGLEK